MTNGNEQRPHPAGGTPQAPPSRYEPYLDGLFTYCLSVLCDHDAALSALGDVLALAERPSRWAPRRGRPAGAAQRRPWLYSLARWACLRRFADARREPPAPLPDAVANQRRRELAALAWPEAAGTSPEQREALELAVRHGLPPEEVAVVLGMDAYTARELLSTAACEVERTRAALIVVEQGDCAVVARLAGDTQVLLGTALRRELVRHVDDCPVCRRTAEWANAGAAWPGSLGAVSPAALPVVEAPRAAAHAAMLHALRARPGHGPRYDRAGFPQDPKARAARRDRLRSRAVTSTVVATVLAAPVLALWTAYRGAPPTGEARGAFPAASDEARDPDRLDGRPVENAGNAQAERPAPRYTAGSRTPDVSVEVMDAGSPSASRSGGAHRGPGRLTVEAQPRGGATLITLHASGGAPVSWRASSPAGWLYFSRTHGTLWPGDTTTLTVTVDHLREPAHFWAARVLITPGAELLLRGHGAPHHPPHTPPPDSSPPDSSSPPPTSSSPDPTPTHSSPPPSSPTPTPSATSGTPTG